MSQDVSDRLKLLTPASPDRDALLFAAGQAAGAAASKPFTIWKWMSGVLATSQVATIAIWFSLAHHPSVSTMPVNPTSTVTTDTPDLPSNPSNEWAESTPPDPLSYLALMKNESFNPTPRPSSQRESEKPSRILTPRWSGELPQ